VQGIFEGNTGKIIEANHLQLKYKVIIISDPSNGFWCRVLTSRRVIPGRERAIYGSTVQVYRQSNPNFGLLNSQACENPQPQTPNPRP
jgi:hypothetical protein